MIPKVRGLYFMFTLEKQVTRVVGEEEDLHDCV